MGVASPGIRPRPRAAPPLILKPRWEAHTTSYGAHLSGLVSSQLCNIPLSTSRTFHRPKGTFSPVVTPRLPPQPLNTTNPAAPRRVGGAAHRAAPAPSVSPGLLTCGACRPLLGRVTFPCADGPRSVCPSPADGHWMAVRRNATVQTCIQVSVWTCFRRPGVGISQEWNGLVAVATLCNW